MDAEHMIVVLQFVDGQHHSINIALIADIFHSEVELASIVATEGNPLTKGNCKNAPFESIAYLSDVQLVAFSSTLAEHDVAGRLERGMAADNQRIVFICIDTVGEKLTQIGSSIQRLRLICLFINLSPLYVAHQVVFCLYLIVATNQFVLHREVDRQKRLAISAPCDLIVVAVVAKGEIVCQQQLVDCSQ